MNSPEGSAEKSPEGSDSPHLLKVAVKLSKAHLKFTAASLIVWGLMLSAFGGSVLGVLTGLLFVIAGGIVIGVTYGVVYSDA